MENYRNYPPKSIVKLPRHSDSKSSSVYTVSYPADQINIRREPPGKGFRHFLGKKQINSFLEILPQWNELCVGLKEIVLARGEAGCDGWYDGSIVAINAWERDLWRVVSPDYYAAHRIVFFRLDVECVKNGRNYLCKFNQFSVRAFQLLHVFLHELGHHFDKMTTVSKHDASRGELFAEEYALRYENFIWQRYMVSQGL